MNSTATLTSLAILRVNLEERRGDYIENLRPFILQVLYSRKPDPVTDTIVASHIREDFGLVVPRRTIQRVLTRLVNDNEVNISENYGKLQITAPLQDPGIEAKRCVAEEDIAQVIEGLKEYSQSTSNPILEDDSAIAALTAFLAQFDITCLSAYERRTAIPEQDAVRTRDIVLVSDYVRHQQESNRPMFERFMVLVKGHMLANALMCPDLDETVNSYSGVTFYLDTPLLVHWLGLESDQEKEAARELVDIVCNLGGQFAVFAHTLEELENVINGAARQIQDNDPVAPIAHEAMRRGVTEVGLRIEASQAETKLEEAGIVGELTPLYIPDFQIDEEELGNILDEKMRGYRTDMSRSHDINSVRSVYVVRGNIPARTLERAKAVLVTTNSGFAQAAWLYGKEHTASHHVSTVITDFSLANLAWLKTPMETEDIPITQILAYSYAALRPPDALWQKYIAEIDRLQEEGRISEDQHILLRSFELSNHELMHLTLGEDEALKDETITQAVQRVTERFTKQADEALEEEKDAHRATSESLNLATKQNTTTKENVYRLCERVGGVIAWIFSAFITSLLLLGLVSSLLINRDNEILAWIVGASSALLLVLTMLNLVFGSTIKSTHKYIASQVSRRLFKLATKHIGAFD